MRSAIVLSMIVLAACSSARAQPAHPLIQVGVRPSVEALSNGKHRVSYRITNQASSRAALFEFAIQSSVPVASISTPAPDLVIVASKDASGPVASWGWLDEMPAPGESTDGLVYEAVGLPGFVRYRALPYTEVPVVGKNGVKIRDEPDSAAIRFEGNGSDYSIGTTVGLVPIPTDESAEALATRLGNLVGRACRMGWVDDRGVCRSLRAKVGTNRQLLHALHNELDAQRGKHVSESAYAVLQPNVAYLIGRL